MDLPDANQWDETTCASAVCPHPQCWAALRRIERGHPRLLGSPCKTPLDTEGLKSMKGLPEKGLISSTNTPPKVSVLNLNETSPLCPQDVRNMAVIWIPEEPEKHKRSPAEKKPDVTNQDGREKRKKSAVENKSALGSLEKQGMGTQLGRQEVLVPPPSPVHLLKQLHTDSILPWDQIDMLPQDLLKDHTLPEKLLLTISELATPVPFSLLTDEGKIIPSSNMKIELAMMKKSRPLEKSRPESAISSKMFLSVHRLTLQKPGLRHPEHLRKLHNNLMSKASLSEAARSPGPKKQQQQKQQQQQRKVKTLTKKQEVKKKTKSDPGSQNTLHERKVIAVYDPVSGHSSLPDEESDTKQQEQMEIEGPTLKQLRVYQGHTARALFKDATEEPGMDHLEKYPDSFTRHSSTELVKTESTKEDIGTQVEFELESQTSSEEKTPRNLSASIDGTIWNPELKLLRILQATDDEDEENQPSRAQSEGSLRAQAEGISHPIQEQDA